MTVATRAFYLPIKDEDNAHGIATAWRPLLRAVVSRLVAGDLALSSTPKGADRIPADLEAEIRETLTQWDAHLVELPANAWDRGIAQWYGNHWVVCLDLWTDRGPSDLVLAGRLVETASGPRFTAYMVYVP